MAYGQHFGSPSIRGVSASRRCQPLRPGEILRTPPFRLEGMSVRMFPLRARVSALQDVCDRRLNDVVPSQVGRFRAGGPYVFLMMVDYGRLAEVRMNMGWFAQKEIAFCFPVHWYKIRNGHWRFHDWAILTPFIYVDDDVSAPLGRQVYGWAKTGARFTPTLSRWMEDTRADVLKARVETMVYPEIYEGRELRWETFLEVEREASGAMSQYPPDPGFPFAPWNVWWNLARGATGWAQDIGGWLSGLGLYSAHPGGAPHNMRAMAMRLLSFFRPDGLGAVWNTLNLKQFRRADDTDLACYQALTNGPMRFETVHGAGALGERRVWAGDASGGYGIKLHEWPSIPIVDTLGLEVYRRWQGPGSTVALLKPVLPFWYNADMEYSKGQTLAWRSSSGDWRRADGSRLTSTDPSPPKSTPYNTAASSSPDPIVGPFQFWDTTIRVLPLLAKRTALEDFLNEYVNAQLPQEEPDRRRLIPWSHDAAEAMEGTKPEGLAYVYLTVSSFGDVDSGTNNVGDWAKYELSFLIPVIYQIWDDEYRAPGKPRGRWKSQSVGIVPAYTFVDTTGAEIARGEVLGVTTMSASFVKPDSEWLSDEVPLIAGRQVLLRLEAETLPAMREGRAAKRFPIVEITEQRGGQNGAGADPRTDVDVDRWVDSLRDELERKKGVKNRCEADYKIARAVALERLGRDRSFAFYTLKQFEEVDTPEKACYTALVRFRRTLEQVLRISEIETLVTVCLHDFPTLKIAQDLGIVANRISEDTAGVIYMTQAVRPFFVDCAMREDLGERLVWRAGPLDDGWQFPKQWESFPDVQIGRELLTLDRLPELGDPRRIEKLIDLLIEDESAGPIETVAHDEAMAALDVIDPQILIESMLSREWGHESGRWVKGWRRVRQEYKDAVAGIRDSRLAGVEQKFFCSVLARGGQRPGHVTAEDASAIIPHLKDFTTERVRLDNAWCVIAEYLVGREHDLRTTSPRGAKDLGESAVAFHASLQEIAAMKVLGYPIAPDDWTQYAGTRARELQARLDVLLKNGLRVIMNRHRVKEQLWRAREELREALSLAHAICDLQREALCIKLSKIDQKPDFCVLRDVGGARKNTLFPLTWSWDDKWYFGPPLEDGPEPLDRTACPDDAPDELARERQNKHLREARKGKRARKPVLPGATRGNEDKNRKKR